MSAAVWLIPLASNLRVVPSRTSGAAQRDSLSVALPQTEVARVLTSADNAGKQSGSHVFVGAFVKSFTLMCAAEIFDRTWFVTLICALRHGAFVSFCGSITALALHSCIAVSLGEGVASFVPQWWMELASAVILCVLALIYTWESYKVNGDDDAIKSRREEAEEDVATDAPGNAQEESATRAKEDSKGSSVKDKAVFWATFVTVFTTIFIAEWGDRTQIVQITLAASLPWLPVFLGSFSGLIVLCLSAVAMARFMEGKRISERLLNCVCAISFGVMAALAFESARQEYLLSRHQAL